MSAVRAQHQHGEPCRLLLSAFAGVAAGIAAGTPAVVADGRLRAWLPAQSQESMTRQSAAGTNVRRELKVHSAREPCMR